MWYNTRISPIYIYIYIYDLFLQEMGYKTNITKIIDFLNVAVYINCIAFQFDSFGCLH